MDISPESIEAGRASIYINKELQRVDIASLNALENKNVITRFPSLSSRCTTVQVLKSPKTDSSIRTIFLPKTVAEMLVHYKAEQDMTKDALGAEYADYNLVVAGPLGMPTEQSTINGALKQLIEENDLPKVVFHSFRHSSITYKLKLNGGDIKAVQGDSGHAQASMVTEQYAHILDDDRRLNAQRLMISSTSIRAQSLKCPIKQRSPSLKTVRSMPTRQQHLPNCWLTPLWPNSSKILQRTYKPLYINSDSFPIGKTAAVCF